MIGSAAAQPHPGDEQPLFHGELASDHAEEHGERTGEQHHEKRDRNARNRNFSELLRETEQPEHAEQHDLHEPADAVVETAMPCW